MSTPPTSAPPTFASTRDELGVIVDFVRELKTKFGSEDEKLCNYAEILSHLDRTMEEHNEVHKKKFVDFCWVNRDGIIARDLKKFRATILDYKTDVFEINFGKIWLEADAESQLVVWRYLLTILAMSTEDADVKADAKHALSILTQPKKKADRAGALFAGAPPDFTQALGGIMGTMFEKMANNPHAQKISECKDVGEAMNLMMQSGIVTDVMSAFTNQDGSVNSDSAGELFGAVTGMLGGAGGGDPANPAAGLAQMFQTNNLADLAGSAVAADDASLSPKALKSAAPSSSSSSEVETATAAATVADSGHGNRKKMKKNKF